MIDKFRGRMNASFNRVFKKEEKIDLKFFNINKEEQAKKSEVVITELIKGKVNEAISKKKFVTWSIHYHLFLSEYDLVFNVINKILDNKNKGFPIHERLKFGVVLAHIFSPMFFKKENEEDILVIQTFKKIALYQLKPEFALKNKNLLKEIIIPYFKKNKAKDKQGLLDKLEKLNLEVLK